MGNEIVEFMVDANERYVERFEHRGQSRSPSRQVTVVTCMDCRIDVEDVTGLRHGEANVLRNAGGVVTDDMIRSLCLSQRVLGTRTIILIHHTECGVHRADEAAFRADLESEVGVTPAWSLEAFADPYASVRQSIERIRRSPFVPHDDAIFGFVYDVADGTLHRVEDPAGDE